LRGNEYEVCRRIWRGNLGPEVEGGEKIEPKEKLPGTRGMGFIRFGGNLFRELERGSLEKIGEERRVFWWEELWGSRNLGTPSWGKGVCQKRGQQIEARPGKGARGGHPSLFGYAGEVNKLTRGSSSRRGLASSV